MPVFDQALEKVYFVNCVLTSFIFSHSLCLYDSNGQCPSTSVWSGRKSKSWKMLTEITNLYYSLEVILRGTESPWLLVLNSLNPLNSRQSHVNKANGWFDNAKIGLRNATYPCTCYIALIAWLSASALTVCLLYSMPQLLSMCKHSTAFLKNNKMGKYACELYVCGCVDLWVLLSLPLCVLSLSLRSLGEQSKLYQNIAILHSPDS